MLADGPLSPLVPREPTTLPVPVSDADDVVALLTEHIDDSHVAPINADLASSRFSNDKTRVGRRRSDGCLVTDNTEKFAKISQHGGTHE